jgi:DNA-binding winged helix-turn-helix (wHTH) protein
MGPAGKISFDDWTLDRSSGELTKQGTRIRLADQAFQILDSLLSRPGEVVTRESLIARLWPRGIVEFESSLNAAVRKLRSALNDDADTPRYIETLPRKGYRFIGRVTSMDWALFGHDLFVICGCDAGAHSFVPLVTS